MTVIDLAQAREERDVVEMISGDARCIACKHSWTTYEVTQETLDKYKVLQQKLDFLRTHLFSEGNVFDCHNCTQWENDHCSLDIPEAGGSFASECSYYYKA